MNDQYVLVCTNPIGKQYLVYYDDEMLMTYDQVTRMKADYEKNSKHLGYIHNIHKLVKING